MFVMDVDKYPECDEFYNVAALPTIIFMKSGTEIDRIIGADSNAIRTKFDEWTKISSSHVSDIPFDSDASLTL